MKGASLRGEQGHHRQLRRLPQRRAHARSWSSGPRPATPTPRRMRPQPAHRPRRVAARPVTKAARPSPASTAIRAITSRRTRWARPRPCRRPPAPSATTRTGAPTRSSSGRRSTSRDVTNQPLHELPQPEHHAVRQLHEFDRDDHVARSHSAQGPVVLGERRRLHPAGLHVRHAPRPTPRTTRARNPRLCAGCHVKPFTTTDADAPAS